MIRCPNCFLPAPVQAPGPTTGTRWSLLRRSSSTEPGPQPTNCSDPDCGRPYPPGWLDADTTCIAMAGARVAGKSIFIAVMLKQLELYGIRVGMDVAPMTPEVRQVFEKYEYPLYRQRGVLPAFPPGSVRDSPQGEPLVFRLTTRDNRNHHLVVRDSGGEDLERSAGEESRRRLSFFSRADHVFFLFDPLRVAGVKSQLRGLVPDYGLGSIATNALDNTFSLVRAGRPRLAVIVSKFDTLQMLRTVEWSSDYKSIMQNAGAAFFRDPGPFGQSNDEDGRLLSEEVRSLLMLLGETQFVAAVEQSTPPGEHRFFAVSALGDPPQGEALSPRGIVPFRCLDPLRWALAGAGIFE
jgi:hypothetical protein